MMTQPKSILCLVCRKVVDMDFTHMENKTYIDHLKSDHHIEYYRHLTLMLNLMDKTYVDYFSNITPVSKPKTLVCILCRKENNFSDEEGDQYSGHLRNEHMIISNIKLIKSINLMDNDGLVGIIKKFEETYNVDDDVNNEQEPFNDYADTDINAGNISPQNDYPNLVKKSENDKEKMLIEEGSPLNDSMATNQREQEEMFGEEEEEFINGSEAMNYYKSQRVDAGRVEKVNIKGQSETLFSDSTSLGNDLMNMSEDSASYSFESKTSLNGSISSPPGKALDSVIKQEASNNLPYGASRSPNKKPSTKGMKIENSDFSTAVQKEIEKGNLSTTMDIPFEKTHKKMKEITGMFMNGTSCTVCERVFNNRSHCHEHIESLHNPLPVFFCHLCQLPVTSSARLRQHKKKCTG